MIPNKFVIFWNNLPVGVDSDSGGYPFKTEEPCLIRYWRTKEEAENYIAIFQRVDDEGVYSGMCIKEIQFRIVDEVKK